MNRRTFLHTTTAAAEFTSLRTLAAGKARPRSVLRSSWQTVNIGDIGHTPGVLALLEKHLPEAELTLWPSDVRDGVEEMLRRRFPKLTITTDRKLIHECDFLLHGSGPYLTAHNDVASWKKETGKPYGVYGITKVGCEINNVSALRPRRSSSPMRYSPTYVSRRFGSIRTMAFSALHRSGRRRPDGCLSRASQNAP
jgi:hypothetical protein